MFLASLLLAVAIGWIRGGSVKRIGRLPLRWVGLLPVPLVLRSVLQHPSSVHLPWVVQGAEILQFVAYALLVVLAMVNRHLPGSGYLIGGSLANALVITANGGRMPVSEWAIHVAAHDLERAAAVARLAGGDSLTHELLGPETRLPWLADIIPLPRPFPFPSVASVGDVLIAVGLMWLVIAAMGTRHPAGQPVAPVGGAGRSRR